MNLKLPTTTFFSFFALPVHSGVVTSVGVYRLCDIHQTRNMPGIDACDLQSNTRFLFRQPRALQWFDRGTLVKRQDGERQAGESHESLVRAARY